MVYTFFGSGKDRINLASIEKLDANALLEKYQHVEWELIHLEI